MDVCVSVAPGRVLFEIGGAPMRQEIARQGECAGTASANCSDVPVSSVEAGLSEAPDGHGIHHEGHSSKTGQPCSTQRRACEAGVHTLPCTIVLYYCFLFYPAFISFEKDGAQFARDCPTHTWLRRDVPKQWNPDVYEEQNGHSAVRLAVLRRYLRCFYEER